MEKLTKNAMNEMKISKAEIAPLTEYLIKDRYQSGNHALQRWSAIGSIYNRIKLCSTVKRTEQVSVFNDMIGFEIKKDERAASSQLASYDFSAVYKWYNKTSRFMVSPRSIVKAYGKYLADENSVSDETPENAENTPENDNTNSNAFTTIVNGLKSARKSLETAIKDDELTSNDLMQIKLFAMGISELIPDLDADTQRAS